MTHPMTALQARTLGIDVGTSGLRVAALDKDGDCLWLEKAEWRVPTLEHGHEQNPNAWWQAFDGLMRALGRDGHLGEVRAMAFAGTSGTVLTMRDDSMPEGPALMYDDPRGREQRDALRQMDIDPDTQIDALARWRWLAEVRGQPGRPASQADWFVHRLTGRHAADSNNALKWGFDPVSERWPAALEERFGEQLPVVQRAGTPVGVLLDGWHKRWSLPADVQVTAGTTDSMAALWASGAEREGDGVTSLGSTLALKLISERPIADAASGVYSHRFGARFAVSGASNTGGRVLAAHFSSEEIERLSREIDPERPDTLGYWPLAGRGERFPVVAPDMGPRLTPRPADPAAFLAGLLRGIARIEALGYRRFAQLGSTPVRRVLSSGGGAGNAVFRTIRARALGVPVSVAEHTEAAVGVARLAALGLRDHPTAGASR